MYPTASSPSNSRCEPRPGIRPEDRYWFSMIAAPEKVTNKATEPTKGHLLGSGMKYRSWLVDDIMFSSGSGLGLRRGGRAGACRYVRAVHAKKRIRESE